MPRLLSRAPNARSLIAVTSAMILALALGVSQATSADAAPRGDPSTSHDAKTLWENSSHQAEVAAENLNGARVVQSRADKAARAAAAAVTAANTTATTSTGRADRSAAAVTRYQRQLNSFASASFRGARLSPLSVMLTARSANDFLDEATVIARVAADSHHTMSMAVQAKTAAAQVGQQARAAQRRAEQALAQATSARDAAATAAVAAQQRKAALDAAVSRYEVLYSRLSATERAAAAAAAAKARAESEAAAQAQLAVQAQANAAAAAARLTTPSSSTAPSAPPLVTSAPSAPPLVTSSPAATTPSLSQRISSSSSIASTTAVAASSSATGSGDTAGEIAAKAALTKVGGGYCYACDGPSSFDCSGLTTWAWAQAGIAIPRVSYEQANFPVVPLDQLQPGDLVTYYSPVSHVAIYVGNGMVVSAVDESSGILDRPVGRGGPQATGHRVPRG
jgi:cell wall-associated NlpC family hydrolase